MNTNIKSDLQLLREMVEEIPDTVLLTIVGKYDRSIKSVVNSLAEGIKNIGE